MPTKFKNHFGEEEHTTDGSTSESEAEEHCRPQRKEKKRPKQEPTLSDLQDAGFRAGPSVLSIKEQPDELSYDWGKGGLREDEDEDFEEREHTRAAATYGAEASIKQAAAAKQQAAIDRQRSREEYATAQQHRRDTYQQREKRKRDIGQAKKGKTYVEEEKRLLRQHNIYSGFDN